ncbi:MAG TPA: amidohydrolase family protein [Actinomycetota bacterium]|nr:amidohydrolase family protein [Actinomycetota bacterium]
MASYIRGATLFDGRSVRTKAGVLVSDGTVAWVGPHARAPREARAAHEVEGAGKTLTPGLIDCHVHLCFEGLADWEGEARGLTEARAALKAVRNLARHLERGVTTVRDLGGIGSVACEVAGAVEEGLAAGPRVVASGQAITITGGHGHTTFALQVDGPDDVRRAVREQIRSGARSIKLVATGGVLTRGIGVDFTAFTDEELWAGIDEAHKWGFPAAAHAIGAGGILQAVRAGIDSVEHGSQITAEAARLMRERGTFHVPTISAIRGILDHAEEVPAFAVEKAAAIAEEARDAFRRALRAGVRHACGTDAGTPFNPHGSAPLEVVRMVEWGMTPLRALQAATANAAELLRVPEVGTVEEGKAADLVLYDADPLEEIEAVLKPALVMKSGEVVSGPAL